MPKKKKGKGKKKKRSKEDLEREEAERLERERRIAEEKAAADALEKKKQAEERKRRQEEAAQRRFEELRRLEAEEKEFIPQDEKKRKLLAVEMAKLSKQLEWDAYLNDDGTPDPSDEPQLNTMMSEWEEDASAIFQKLSMPTYLLIRYFTQLTF